MVETGGRWRRRGGALLPLLAGLAFCLWYARYQGLATGGALGLPLDDSWIHLRFARSLASGAGLAYQGPAWVNGSTGPLWTALLSLGFVLPGSPVLWAQVLGVAAYMLLGATFYRLALRFGLSPTLAALSTTALMLTDAMLWSALSGMEVCLFAWLCTLGLLFQQAESQSGWRSAWSLPVLALAAGARPEALLLLGLAVLERLPSWRREGVGRALLLGSLLAGVVLAPAVCFSLLVSGAPFPSTLAAKTAGWSKWLPTLRDYWRGAEILFRPQPWALLLAGGGMTRLASRRLAGRPCSVLPALWLLALPGAYSLLAAPGQPMPVGNFGRYLYPLFPVVVLLGALGLQPAAEALTKALSGRSLALRRALPVGVAAALLAPTARAAWVGAGRYAVNVANVQASDVAAGRWIAENLDPGALLAVQDIGAIAYLAPNPIIDLVGIVDAEIARTVHAEGLDGLLELVRRRGARYLVVFPESYGGTAALASRLPGLEIRQRFPVPANITMAGSELAILEVAPPPATP